MTDRAVADSRVYDRAEGCPELKLNGGLHAKSFLYLLYFIVEMQNGTKITLPVEK